MTSVWFQINRCMVNTIWFRFDFIRFRKDMENISLCVRPSSTQRNFFPFLSNVTGYDCAEIFLLFFKSIGILVGRKTTGKFRIQWYPIQFDKIRHIIIFVNPFSSVNRFTLFFVRSSYSLLVFTYFRLFCVANRFRNKWIIVYTIEMFSKFNKRLNLIIPQPCIESWEKLCYKLTYINIIIICYKIV